MKFDVKHGKDMHKLEVPDDATLGQLKEALAKLTKVPVGMQKLTGKPNLKDDSKLLTDCGFKAAAASNKLMLIGSSAQDVVEANAEPVKPAGGENDSGVGGKSLNKTQERAKMIKNLPGDFWTLAPFGSLLADPHIDGKGTPVEGGNAALSLAVLDVLLSRLNVIGVNTALIETLDTASAASLNHPFLTLTPPESIALAKAHNVIRKGCALAETLIKWEKPEEVVPFADEVVEKIDGLATGDFMMIPSGWVGLNSMCVMYLLVKRTSPKAFTVTVVNTGSGIEYHPAVATPDKVKYQTCLELENVSATRLLDPAFWFVSLSLWLKAVDPSKISEYSRVEVLYDVLFPWLVEVDAADESTPRSLASMIMEKANTSTPELFHTPQRSESSATKAATTALKVLLKDFGVSLPKLKMIKFALRYEAFVKAAEELQLAAGRCDPTPRLTAARDGLTQQGIDSKEVNTSLNLLFDALGPKEFVKTNANVILNREHFNGKVVALYFSGSWCGPCKKITPLLVEAYKYIQKRLLGDKYVEGGVGAGGGGGGGALSGPRGSSGSNVEFIFVSCDRSTEEFNEYAAKMPFARVTFPCRSAIEAFDISSIPTLLIFGPDGQLMTNKGVDALIEDPEALKFPNAPWTGARSFNCTDVDMLKIALGQVAYDATKKNKDGLIADEKLEKVSNLISAVDTLVDAMPNIADEEEDAFAALHKQKRLEAKKANNNGEKKADAEGSDSDDGDDQVEAIIEDANNLNIDDVGMFDDAGLLKTISRVHYHGKPFDTKMPSLGDMTKVKRATTLQELRTALTFAENVVSSLWKRAKYSGTASRVAVQMQIIEFISWFFSAIVPVPAPTGAAAPPTPGNNVDVTSNLYHTPYDAASDGQADMQMEMLGNVYKLILSYTTAWQSVEVPTRGFDAERALIAMTILAVYDALARNQEGASAGFMLSFLLNDDGGYYVSTNLTKSAKSFRDVSARMELTKPFFLHQRAAVITYFEANEKAFSNELFDFRMPDKFEIRKYSHTVQFLRKFLENCGYEIMARAESNPMMAGQSEMETLMGWLCDPKSPMAKEHPEFGMLRDVVLLAKFLATMEMRDAQLLRKKKELDEYATWRISFDEDAPGRQMSAGWRTSPRPPLWELMMVRGRDQDIADIAVKGFGDRELAYGEGLLVQSPIDVSALLGVDHPTEDDILHAKTLPTFGDVLSQEESETLLSCLTVTYMRIPLLLDFFASNDRHTYLFSPQIQNVFRATLFEPGEFVDPAAIREVSMVPLRLTATQKRAVQTAQMVSATAGKDDSELLGTPHGILLNELIHSPASVLLPLRSILRTIAELGPSSVYSMNASYVLFLSSITCDVLRFVHFAQQNHPGANTTELQTHRELICATLRELVAPLLKEWIIEANDNDDTPTLCVVHSFNALLLEAMLRPENTTVKPAAAPAVAPGSNTATGVTWTEEDFAALLGSCAFVRARHGFGMGMMRTQLAAQEGDNMLSAEEKLVRFLQAQGLDTRRVTTDMLEHGRRLMMSGGRRRAVFVHIRSRYYNDTVRVPNLIHANATSATESKAHKLPPCDVPENALFSLLQQYHGDIVNFMASCDEDKLNRIMCNVIQVVLKEKELQAQIEKGQEVAAAAAAESGSAKSPTDRWAPSTPGILAAPLSGLVFHVNTCELFWRNDELKPVPDSMSHFADYETILGKDVKQCGLVNRTEHRHWVHVVGTKYDLIEWDAPDPTDQGVCQPIILRGPPDAERIEEVMFEEVRYNRPIDIDEEVPWSVIQERWAVDIVTAVLKDMYPMPQEMKYRALLPEKEAIEDQDTIRLIMNDGQQYEDEEDRTTWKEMVVTKNPKRLLLFNLVPHARKMYRSLVFTTDQQTALHSLAAIKKPRSLAGIKKLKLIAGEPKKRVQNESSLEIIRQNTDLGGSETYIPARLLQGLIPSGIPSKTFCCSRTPCHRCIFCCWVGPGLGLGDTVDLRFFRAL